MNANSKETVEGSSSDNRRSAAKQVITVTRPELLKDGSDADFRKMVHDLLAFSSRLEAVRQSFGTIVGLSGIQYTLLISVSHLQQASGVGVKALAEHLSLSGAFVTIETGKLVKKGLIGKRTNPEDRRRVQLFVTELGQEHLSNLAPVQQEVNDVLFGSLSQSDFDRLSDIVDGLVSDAERAVQLSNYVTGKKRLSQ